MTTLLVSLMESVRLVGVISILKGGVSSPALQLRAASVASRRCSLRQLPMCELGGATSEHDGGWVAEHCELHVGTNAQQTADLTSS